MKQYSTKRAKQMREYKKIRDKYLEDKPLCERCGSISNQVHHQKGRIGDLLTDNRYFLSVCEECHRHIEDHPRESREKGFTISRL